MPTLSFEPSGTALGCLLPMSQVFLLWNLATGWRIPRKAAVLSPTKVCIFPLTLPVV